MRVLRCPDCTAELRSIPIAFTTNWAAGLDVPHFACPECFATWYRHGIGVVRCQCMIGFQFRMTIGNASNQADAYDAVRRENGCITE